MLTCTHCNAPLVPNLKFCPWCGAPVESGLPAGKPDAGSAASPKEKPEKPRFCGGCGAKLPRSCSFCLICGLKPGEEPAFAADAAPPPSPVAEKSACIAKNNRDIAVVCIMICTLLSLTVLGFWAFRAVPVLISSGKSIVNDSVLYATLDGKLKIDSPLLDVPGVLAARFTSRQRPLGPTLAKSSAQGRYIAYLNDYAGDRANASGNLYLLDFGERFLPDAAMPGEKLISGGVTDTFFFMNNGGSLVYLKQNGELCVTDYTESTVLDTKVTAIIEHTNTQILFKKSSKNGKIGAFSAYVLTLGETGQVVTVDENIVNLADYTPAFEKFVYLREQSDGNRDIIAYDFKLGSYSTLAVGADALIFADAATFTALYQTASVNSLRYENLILDDYLLSDDALAEPDLDAFPLLSEYYDKNGVDAAGTEILDQNEDLAEESAAFKAILEAYDAKLRRDKWRAEINREMDKFITENPTLYDLHLTRDGLPVRLAEGSYVPFYTAKFDPSTGIAAWTSANWRGVHKISINNYENAMAQRFSFGEYLAAGLSDSLYVCPYGRSPMSVRIGDGQFYSGGFALTEKSDGIYFAMGAGSPLKEHPENLCALYYAPLFSDKSGTIVMLDEHVAGVGEMFYGDKLLYYKDRARDFCDLYMINGSKSEKIGDRVSLSGGFFALENGGKTLLYCEHFNEAEQSGDLFMRTEQSRQIAGNVRRVYYQNDGLIYFLRGGAELYSFNEDGLSRVDENVAAVMK